MRKNNKRKGFTIVELVIVIAVIAILAAVMIPTISGVIADANEAALQANAKAAYTQYITATTQAGNDAEENLIIKISDDEFFAVVDGAIVLAKDGDRDVAYTSLNAAKVNFTGTCVSYATNEDVTVVTISNSHGDVDAEGVCPDCNVDTTP